MPKLHFDPIDEAARQWRSHGWTEAADGMAAITSIMRVQQIYLARVDEILRKFALTFARYELLMLLGFTQRGSMAMHAIGARLQVHPTSVTNAVDRLEAHGLIKRVPDPNDRRRIGVQILPEGQALAQQATDALNREVFEQAGLSEEELHTLHGLLRKLRFDAGDFILTNE